MGDNLGTVTHSIPKKSQTMAEISEFLGIPVTGTTAGSSVPRIFFSDIASQMGTEVKGTMPATARIIIESNGLLWHPDFSSENSPSGGGGTVTALGLLQVKNAVLAWLGKEIEPLPIPMPVEEWQPNPNWRELKDALPKEALDVATRPDAEKFRLLVLNAYDDTCVITGIRTTAAIEVAHIVPYYGKESDQVQNAIPLRSDIHKLFDRGLIKINYDSNKNKYVVNIHELIYQDYSMFDGNFLISPDDFYFSPSRPAFVIHNDLHKALWATI
jgi:hypothetical protein